MLDTNNIYRNINARITSKHNPIGKYKQIKNKSEKLLVLKIEIKIFKK